MASMEPRELESAIVGGQSPDNAVRERSEQFILEKIAENPGLGCTLLIEFALQDERAVEHRLYSLLTLRKLVTMHWSAGFESYIGPPGIGEENKPFIRDALLKLGLDDLQNSRIVAGSSYCIVQIAAVDFPDSWPELLAAVFDAIVTKQSLSALRLLNEIFDDIVSEEMFFQGGVGWQTIQLVTEMLKSEKFALTAKIAAGNLYCVCLGQLQLPSANATKALRDSVTAHLRETLRILIEGIRSYSSFDISNLDVLELLRVMFECVNKITTSFSKSVVTSELNHEIKTMVIEGLARVSQIRQTHKFTYESKEFTAVDELGCELLQALGNINNLALDESQLHRVIEALIFCSALIDDDIEKWEADFNSFITIEEGLSGPYRMRNASEDFLQDSPAQLCELITDALLTIFPTLIRDDWKLGEAILFLFKWLYEDVEFSIAVQAPRFIEFMTFLNDSITAPHDDQNAVLLGRMLIVVPRMLKVTKTAQENWNDMVKSFVDISMKLALKSNDDILEVAFLKCFCEYAQISDLHDVLGELSFHLRDAVCRIIEEVSVDSEEDTISVILQALTAAASLKLEDNKGGLFYHNVLKLLLNISSKNPSNIEVVLEAEECLSTIMKRVTTPVYTAYSETCMPLIVGSLNRLICEKSDYSPSACLSLELLKVFMKRKPIDGPIPAAISDFVLKPLIDILVNSYDDAITQLSSDCLVFLIHNSSAEEIEPLLPLIISTLEKLLSDETSDSGAMNVGPLVLVAVQKFPGQLHELFPRIMEAATRKFVTAENISTSENLLSLFCYLMAKSPEEVISFLSSFSVDEEAGDALNAVLPKWLDAFEVVRGNKRITENIKALSKLFFQEDERVSRIQVRGEVIPYEGDLIVTRSMAKNMPQEYKMISFYEKVAKLFVSELEFQSKQSNVDKYVLYDVEKYDDQGKGEGEGDWEDVDSVLEFERLQGHLDDDSEPDSDYWESGDDSASDLGDSYDGVEQGTSKEKGPSARELLISFFRDAASKNLNSFHAIYERLSDHEKKVLSENLI
ncbi:LAME_0H20648g1_1 [Lachancea meyersii CBS 8951]|uniref:LAME_0H20648g1_1 n=1 Tax=Lachancea meyersii CBS 8951 TaxID=1266667 RepID=A0A1G4KJP7_9SACH|nr:LAME_0H20648g1_1 [Lachancea meyersii CBS 8951]